MNKLIYMYQEIKRKIDYWYVIKRGFYDENFCPLKCFNCDNKELENCNEDYLDGRILLEYDCKCKKCGKILNHWAYGHWDWEI